MIGLFALRCIAPLLLTIGLCHLMNRLIDRWELQEARQGAAMPTTGEPKPAMPIACWILKNCDEEKRARCPAYRRQGIPCWQARMIEEGKLPVDCPTCPQYTAALNLPAL